MVQPVYDFTDKVAFVTGASSGMGAETARWFARAGASVVLADVNKDLVHEVAKELTDCGLRARAVHCDVADEEQVRSAVGFVTSQFGRLDYAFNAAGIHVPATDIADEDALFFDRINGVNLRGIWASMKHELSVMRRTGIRWRHRQLLVNQRVDWQPPDSQRTTRPSSASSD